MQAQIVDHTTLFWMQDPCAAVRRANRAISHLYDQVLSPTGLNVSQFIILNAIADRAEVAQWRLSSEYGISNESLSRRLSLLRRKGFIACRIGCDHPGERLYCLTPKGVETLHGALPHWERAQERLRQAIGNMADWDLLLKSIDKICLFAQLAEHGRFANTVAVKAKASAAAGDKS